MATYNYSGNPATSDTDWIRFKLAETDVSGGADSTNFSDEEIQTILTEHAGDRWQAGHTLLLQRGQKFIRLALAAGSDELEQIISANQAAISQFLSEAAAQGITVTIPAQSIATKEILTMDADAVQPRFFRGMNDMPSVW